MKINNIMVIADDPKEIAMKSARISIGLFSVALPLLFLSFARADVRIPVRPDVTIVVFAMADEQDQIAFAYHGTVPRAQANRDMMALQAATGVVMKSIKITNAPTPGLKHGEKTTSVEAIAPHFCRLQSSDFTISPYVTAFRGYANWAITMFVDNPTAFKGANTYNNAFVNITLDQQPHMSTYWVTIKDSHFQHIKIPDLRSKAPQTPVVTSTAVAQQSPRPAKRGNRSALVIALVAVVATGAGMLVYFSMARNT